MIDDRFDSYYKEKNFITPIWYIWLKFSVTHFNIIFIEKICHYVIATKIYCQYYNFCLNIFLRLFFELHDNESKFLA